MHEETLRYLHQCLAFAFMRQTRFREATAHFVKGAIDPRIPLSYFDDLRPALFSEPSSHTKDDTAKVDFVEVEVWDGVREYMPDESCVDDISESIYRFSSPSLPRCPTPPTFCSSLANFPPHNRLPAIQLTLFPFFSCPSQPSSRPIICNE